MKKTYMKISALFLVLAFTAACGESKEKESTETKQTSVKETQEPEVEPEEMDIDELEEFEEDEFQLPTALQVAQMMNKQGLTFSEGLTNDPDNVSNYSSELSKKLNFGIYSADLAYCVINEKYSEAQSYMEVVRRLGSETGLDRIFDSEDLLKAFEENMQDQQGLMDVLVEINWRTEEVFETDMDAKKKSVVHFAGAWMEGMYLGAKLLEEDFSEDIGTTLVEQMNVLTSLIKGLNKLEDSNLAEFKQQLQDVMDTYNGFESVKASNNSETGVYENPVLSSEELSTLSNKIIDIRTSIVNG